MSSNNSVGKYRIDIDKRERDLLNAFGENKNVRAQHMTTGDIAIYVDNILKLLIERKTWRDLAASIKDGRAVTQNPRLMEVGNDMKCKVMIIVEGKPSAIHGRIPIKTLKAKLDNLMLINGFYITYSKNIEDTVNQIVIYSDIISKNYYEDLKIKNTVGGDHTETKDVEIVVEENKQQTVPDALTKVVRKSESDQAKDFLYTFRKLRPVLKNIKNKSVMDIYNMSVEDMNNIKGRKSINPEDIIYDIRHPLNQKKALTKITGVSTVIADNIVSFSDDIAEWTESNLAELKAPNGRRFGNKLAKRINDVLNCKI